MSFCAECLDDRAPLVPRPLGRNGGTVLVCPDCDPGDIKPTRRKGKPVYRGYTVPPPRVPIGNTLKAFSAAANRIAPVATSTVPTRYSGGQASPGFVIVRVRRLRAGYPIDRDIARKTLRDEPWYSELRHLGSDARFHIFERPDVELAARVRNTANFNAVDDLKNAVGKVKR